MKTGAPFLAKISSRDGSEKLKITFTTGTISCMINVAFFACMEKESAKRSLNNEVE